MPGAMQIVTDKVKEAADRIATLNNEIEDGFDSVSNAISRLKNVWGSASETNAATSAFDCFAQIEQKYRDARRGEVEQVVGFLNSVATGYEIVEDQNKRLAIEYNPLERYIGQRLGAVTDASGKPVGTYSAAEGNLSDQIGLAGQCTWYAYGRFAEVTGIKLYTAMHAKYWLANNRDDNRLKIYEGINSIREHSIVVYNSGDFGHVAFIEGVVRDSNGNPLYVYLTEANGANDDKKHSVSSMDGVLQKIPWETFIEKPITGYITAA